MDADRALRGGDVPIVGLRFGVEWRRAYWTLVQLRNSLARNKIQAGGRNPTRVLHREESEDI